MAKLTKNDILHVAALSNLNLSDSEIDKFSSQLSKIIDYVSELSEVETGDVDPISQTLPLQNVLRADVVNTENMLTSDEALSGTDDVYNNLFKVDAILSERTDK